MSHSLSFRSVFLPAPCPSRLLMLAVVLWVAGPAAAQTSEDGLGDTPCAVSLEQAEALYVQQSFAEVEPLVNACVYSADVTQAELVQSYRLLALSFMRQNLLHEAQVTIIKLVSADYTYEPDPIQDPPLYVSMVAGVQDQLRVAAASAPVQRAPVQAAPVSQPVSPAVSGPAAEARININTASSETLQSLYRIGPVLAGRIIEYRQTRGPFRSTAEIMEVSGIGERTYERLAPHITVDGPTASQRAAGGLPPNDFDVTAVEPRVTPDVGDAVPATPERQVDLNTASSEELQTLNGIGPALAGRIIEYRETRGPFRRVDDLTEVSGIGPRTLERLAPYVTVGDRD